MCFLCLRVVFVCFGVFVFVVVVGGGGGAYFGFYFSFLGSKCSSLTLFILHNTSGFNYSAVIR